MITYSFFYPTLEPEGVNLFYFKLNYWTVHLFLRSLNWGCKSFGNLQIGFCVYCTAPLFKVNIFGIGTSLTKFMGKFYKYRLEICPKFHYFKKID